MVRSFMRLLLTRLALACATAAIEDIAAGGGVAVCVAGQARTLNASAVYRNIHESMVRPLRDAHHRVDVFLALAPSKGPGFDYANNPLAPELVARLRPVALDWASVDQNKPAPEVCDARCGIWGMGCKGLGQTTHQEACLRDIERRERLVGKRYAWVLLGRPDVATGRTLTPEALRAAAGAAASVTSRNGTVFSRPGRCHAEAYCRSDTWALATRRAADVYVHAMAREFRRRTGCADARRAIVAALAGTGARVHGSGTGRTSVCVECRLAYTLRTGGVALCGGLAAEGIVRWRGVRADGSASTQGPVPLAISADAGRFVRLAGRTAPVLFEHPVEGRCGATAAAMVGRPWALCPHDLC